MSALVAIAMSNLLVASVFALLALVASRLWRRPALAHGFWVLFFIKLLTPPLFPVQVAWTMSPPVEIKSDLPLVEELPPPVAAGWPEDMGGAAPAAPPEIAADVFALVNPAPAAGRIEPPPAPADEPVDIPWAKIGTAAWLAGSLCWLSLAWARLGRFRKQLRFAQPAPAHLQSEARRLAERLQVTCPAVWILPGPVSPMLWVLGRTPRLLVPAGLLERLDDAQRQALLVHELAHWRRRDHWVRWLELAALGLYWWCPLVWWARRHLQEAEEECCDAWVVWLMPEAARGYALALVETVDFMASARTALPPVASGIGHVRLLKRRLTMIMRGTTPRTLTLGGGLAVLGLGALLLPLVPSWAQSPRRAGQPAAEQPDPGQGDPFRDQLQALNKAQQDIRRMQAELERARADLERRTRDVNRKMEQVRREMEAVKSADPQGNAPRPMQPGRGGVMAGGGFGGAFPGGGGFGGGVGGPGGGIGAPGMAGFGGGFPGSPPADLDKRLREVERKLDLLIQMMRQGMRPGATGVPGARGGLPSANVPAYPPAPFLKPGGGGSGGLIPGQPYLPSDPSAPAPAPQVEVQEQPGALQPPAAPRRGSRPGQNPTTPNAP